MALAGARAGRGGADLAALDEAELGERQDAVAIERGWKEKSKPASVLMAESRAICSAVLMRRLSRMVSSSVSSASIASSGADLAAFDAADGVVEYLDRARHLEAHQGAAGCVRAPSRRDRRAPSWRLLRPGASRRATAS